AFPGCRIYAQRKMAGMRPPFSSPERRPDLQELFCGGVFSRCVFGRRSGGGGNRGGGVFLSLLDCVGAFLGLLARLRLRRIVACVALGDAGAVEEAGDTVGRQRAVAEPMLDALFIELHAVAV